MNQNQIYLPIVVLRGENKLAEDLPRQEVGKSLLRFRHMKALLDIGASAEEQ